MIDKYAVFSYSKMSFRIVGKRDKKMNEFLINEEKNIISVDGDASELFEKNPLAMLEAVRLVAETGCDLHKLIYNAILENVDLLDDVETTYIRECFGKIIVGDYAGKGLKMLDGTGLISHIIGELDNKMTEKEAENLSILMKNIDKTKKILTRRLGLFYACFGTDAAADAIDILSFDYETKRLLRSGVTLINYLDRQSNHFELKQFIKYYGYDVYDYTNNLAKAKSLVYDLDQSGIRSRNLMMSEIKKRGEPVFLEDMNIERDDLIEHEIVEEEKADEMMLMLLDAVHKDPKKNTKEALLKQAMNFKLNPIQAKFRTVQWTK